MFYYINYYYAFVVDDIIFVRDNQWLAVHYNARRRGKEPLRSAFKSVNARLAVDYPAYYKVIWSFPKL